jgi:hypothetical protein
LQGSHEGADIVEVILEEALQKHAEAADRQRLKTSYLGDDENDDNIDD